MCKVGAIIARPVENPVIYFRESRHEHWTPCFPPCSMLSRQHCYPPVNTAILLYVLPATLLSCSMLSRQHCYPPVNTTILLYALPSTLLSCSMLSRQHCYPPVNTAILLYALPSTLLSCSMLSLQHYYPALLLPDLLSTHVLTLHSTLHTLCNIALSSQHYTPTAHPYLRLNTANAPQHCKTLFSKFLWYSHPPPKPTKWASNSKAWSKDPNWLALYLERGKKELGKKSFTALPGTGTAPQPRENGLPSSGWQLMVIHDDVILWVHSLRVYWQAEL